MALAASSLRTNICKILNVVLETGRRLGIVGAFSPKSKTIRITKRPGLISGDPEDLARIDWSKEWNPDGNF